MGGEGKRERSSNSDCANKAFVEGREVLRALNERLTVATLQRAVNRWHSSDGKVGRARSVIWKGSRHQCIAARKYGWGNHIGRGNTHKEVRWSALTERFMEDKKMELERKQQSVERKVCGPGNDCKIRVIKDRTAPKSFKTGLEERKTVIKCVRVRQGMYWVLIRKRAWGEGSRKRGWVKKSRRVNDCKKRN